MMFLLYKTFVGPFYKSNAGFFLFFFFLFFGTVNGGMLITYHLSLVQSIIDSPVVLAGVLLLWLLYNVKCIRFCRRGIQSGEGIFLYNLQAFGLHRQLRLLGTVHLLQYAPVLAYALWASAIAIRQQQWLVAATIGGWQVLMLAAGAVLHCGSINSSWKEVRPFPLLSRRKKRRPQSFRNYLLYYLVQVNGKALFFIKLFSFALVSVMLLNGVDTGRDYLVLVFLVILLAHIRLPFQLTWFMERRLQFHRNLPLPMLRIAATYVYTFALLLLPDVLLLLVKSRGIFPPEDILALYVFGVVSFFLLVSVLYNDRMNMNEYTKVVFALFFVSVFGLYGRYYAVLIGAEVLIGILLFWSGYPRYEGEPIE